MSKNPDMGKNMGQGLANVNDNQRRDLKSREGDPRKVGEQDQRTAGPRDQGRAKDDPSRAPESGTP